MATKSFKTRVQHKTDTSANWGQAADSFKPLKGEICFYSDINKIKIGDGTHYINELDFVEGADIDNATTSAAGLMSAADKTKLDGLGAGANKYTATNAALTPSSGVCTWTITSATHGFSDMAIIVQLYEVSTGKQVLADISVGSTYTVTIEITSAESISADTYRVVIMG